MAYFEGDECLVEAQKGKSSQVMVVDVGARNHLR
jgi:hypothetical protein